MTEALQNLSDFAVASICEGHTVNNDLVASTWAEAARRGLVWHWEAIKMFGVTGLQLRTNRTGRPWDLTVPHSPGGQEWDNRRKR